MLARNPIRERGEDVKICIYGAGSLGTVLGAFLAKAGLEVDLVSRNEGHVAGLRAHGAHVTGTMDFAVPVHALLPSGMRDRYDLVFLMTKQQDNARVVEGLGPFMSDAAAICTFQNGLPEAGIAALVGAERTFGCAVAWGATLHGDGVSELTSEPSSLTFSLGTPGKDNGKMLGEIKSILETMGPVEVEDNFLGARWSKLLVNSAFSGMSAVLGCSFGGTMRRRSRKYVQAIMKECLDVARKAGIVIEKIQGKDPVLLFDYQGPVKRALGYLILPLAIARHRRLKASMLQDLEAGKPTEVDAINGVVGEYGRKYGVPTPFNDLVVSIVHDIEGGGLRPSFANLGLFDAVAGRGLAGAAVGEGS